MTRLRIIFILIIILVLSVLSACGSKSPLAPDSETKSDQTPVFSENTGGISIDYRAVEPSSDPFPVLPGGSYLIQFDVPGDIPDAQYKLTCSGGVWFLDGSPMGTVVTTSSSAVEWRAPVTPSIVHISVVSVNVPYFVPTFNSINVTPDPGNLIWMGASYDREASLAHPVSGKIMKIAEGELLVKLKNNEPITEIAKLADSRNFTVIERVGNSGSIFRLKIKGANFISSWADIASDARVEVAEPNYLAWPTMVPDDPDYDKKFEFQSIDAEKAWDFATGSNDVWVAVVDTGVDRNHPDLADNIIPGMDFIVGGDGLGGETPGDGIDNNQDGCVDQNVGHGTHVAGIIAAQAFNGAGACGIAFNTKILPLRIFPTNGDTGATFSSIIGAVEYASDEEKVKVISMSIGTTYESSLLQAAIDGAWKAGKVLVAAAANSNTNEKYYPAAHNHVIGVVALKKTGEKASFSNYGDWVDISAYGTGIYSTIYDDGYAYMSGTSMACPLVSGCCALLFAYDPNLTNEQCVQMITFFTDDVYELNPDFVGQLGSGVVNPGLALEGLSHSQPGDLGDAESGGTYSDNGLTFGPNLGG